MKTNKIIKNYAIEIGEKFRQKKIPINRDFPFKRIEIIL